MEIALGGRLKMVGKLIFTPKHQQEFDRKIEKDCSAFRSAAPLLVFLSAGVTGRAFRARLKSSNIIRRSTRRRQVSIADISGELSILQVLPLYEDEISALR